MLCRSQPSWIMLPTLNEYTSACLVHHFPGRILKQGIQSEECFAALASDILLHQLSSTRVKVDMFVSWFPYLFFLKI